MDIDWLLNYLADLPPELAIFILAMIPLTELRASIPIGLGVYHLPIFTTYFLSVVGDIVPMIFILLFIRPISQVLMKRFRLADKFFNWIFVRTRRKFTKKYSRWGALALVIFVAIPLPITGSWTGALAAFLFDIPLRKAFFLITLGVMIAGVIVTLISIGAFVFVPTI